MLIIVSDRSAPLEHYPPGFGLRLPRSPVVEVEAPYSLLAGARKMSPWRKRKQMKGSLLTPMAIGGEVAEGVDAGGAADQNADEVVSPGHGGPQLVSYGIRRSGRSVRSGCRRLADCCADRRPQR
jgi:hypothetical protein